MREHNTTDLLFIGETLIRFRGEDCYMVFQNSGYQLFETATGKFVYHVKQNKLYQLDPVEWFDMLGKIEVTQDHGKDMKPPVDWEPTELHKFMS